MKRNRILTLLALISAAVLSTAQGADEASSQMPSQQEMWQMIQAQQKQIEALTAMVEANQAKAASTEAELASAKATATQAQVEASSTRKELANTQAQLEATTLAVEEVGDGISFGSAGWWENTSIGGYGELHANFYDDSDENEIDFHRFVLYFNHEYNDWITLYSELEIEHSDTTQDGAVELEQAFIRMDWTENFSTDAGLFLVPVGITNETHEPNTFYGVERNRVENRIIPTTWREAGIKANYRMSNGLAFEGGISSGLNVGDDYRIRTSREDVSEAPLQEAAFFGRVKYTGIAGLELAASALYQDDLAQDSDDDFADDNDFSGLLTSAHAIYGYEGFSIKALYAQWDLSGDVADSDAETQYGWYIEPSYRWTFSEDYGDLGVFVRFSDYEYYRGDKGGQLDNEVITLGMNWWPTENVVFKVDYQDYDNGADDNDNDNDHSVNLGVGYQF